VACITYACEGWHNNHHYYEVASRQGFFWWEVDITYYVLRSFAAVGLIWELKEVPKHIKFSKKQIARTGVEEAV